MFERGQIIMDFDSVGVAYEYGAYRELRHSSPTYLVESVILMEAT